jgi:hypothetical protein
VILTRHSDDQIKEEEGAVPAASVREKRFFNCGNVKG